MNLYFTIPGSLKSLNEYIESCRHSKFSGNNMKHEQQAHVLESLVPHIRRYRQNPMRLPVTIEYTFFERNKKRDHDNVSSWAHKVVQDTLVEAKILPDDGWEEIAGFSDKFFLDRKNPRIEVRIKEAEYG